jgi:ABC-type Mn2+/Zn2+ transport system ATPase subunit
LLKSFSEECKINIFVVHHSIMNQQYFDRIIKIDKNVFSTIEEVGLQEIQDNLITQLDQN